jgi:hypothetical protein
MKSTLPLVTALITSLVTSLGLAACNASKADKAPQPGTPAEPAAPPAPTTAPPTSGAGDTVAIDHVRAAPTISQDAAIAFVKSWLEPFAKKRFAADAGLGAAVVHVTPECGGGTPDPKRGACLGARLHEIMGAKPELVLKVAERGDIDDADDVSRRLRALDGVTYVTVDNTMSFGDIEYITMTFALVPGTDGAPAIVGLQVYTAYAPEMDH